MKDELLWSLLGGVIATSFNILYNYIRESRNRRWSVAAEITGEIDFYYQRLVEVIAHLESVFEDQNEALSKEEWRSIKMETSSLLIDEQKTRAKVDIVYGVDSYESSQYEEILNLLKNNISTALSISEKYTWIEKKKELREALSKVASIRPTYRKTLVNKAGIWPILTSQIK